MHILVADTRNDRIQIFDLDGNYVDKFGEHGSGDGMFMTPIRITTNSTHILVADLSNHRIQIFDLDGNYVTSLAAAAQTTTSLRTHRGVDNNPHAHPGCRQRQPQDTDI